MLFENSKNSKFRLKALLNYDFLWKKVRCITLNTVENLYFDFYSEYRISSRN